MSKAIEEKRKIHEKKLEQCRKANDDIQANKRIVKIFWVFDGNFIIIKRHIQTADLLIIEFC